MGKKRCALENSAIPPEDLDLFVACGEVLLREESDPFGIRGHRPYFLQELWDARVPILQAYTPPEGLCQADFENRGEEGRARRLARVTAILERMQRKGSPVAGPQGFHQVSPPVFAVLAGLSACWVFKGTGARLKDLYPLLDHYCPTPSSLRKVLDEMYGLVLFSWSWPEGKPIRASRLRLSPEAIRLLGLPGPPARKKGEPRREEKQPKRRRESPPKDVEPFTVVLEDHLRLADVVLPPEPLEELAFLAASLRQWTPPFPVALFLGPPGTGKTHAARALAGELRRPLVLGEIPRLIDKWIGDTEKNFHAIFQFAGRQGGILFLDEADALLMDRGLAIRSWELSQVNTLLSLLDRPAVPVVLCTNFVEKMDAALHRRIHHRIEFPVPGARERERIWCLELKRQGFHGGFDFGRLAEVPLTGGLIRNAIQRAARLRALSRPDYTITTAELVRMAEGERAKMGSSFDHRVPGFQEASVWPEPKKPEETKPEETKPEEKVRWVVY